VKKVDKKLNNFFINYVHVKTKQIPQGKMAAAQVQEFFTVYVIWHRFAKDIRGEEMADWNFTKNLEAFDEHVNHYLSEGWRLHGSPTFSSTWLTRSGGMAIQALVRDTNIEQAVVVQAQLPVVAENVQATRSSLRIRGLGADN